MPDPMVKAWAFLQDQTVSALINYAREPPSNLNELVGEFIRLQGEDCHVFSFYETCPTNLLRQFVLG